MSLRTASTPIRTKPKAAATATAHAAVAAEAAVPDPRLIPRSEQQRDAWCYAACAAMVIDFCHPTDDVRQCDIASFVKSPPAGPPVDCCHGFHPECVQTGCKPEDISRIFEHWEVAFATTGDPQQPFIGPLGFDELRDECAAGRPVEVVVDWSDQPGSHAVLLIAANEARQWVFVLDPLENGPYNGWHSMPSLLGGFGQGQWVKTWRGLRKKVEEEAKVEAAAEATMAHTEESITPQILDWVARQIADAVDSGLEDRLVVTDAPLMATAEAGDDAAAAPPLDIGASFTVWKLRAEAFAALEGKGPAGDIVGWVMPVGLLHHQIRLQGQVSAFARSAAAKGVRAPGELSQLNVSPLAGLIEEALAVIERNEAYDPVVAANPVVRLLEIPAYRIVALWLWLEAAHESRVLIAAAPEPYKLPRARFLKSAEFFNALKEQKPISDIA